MSVDPDAVVEGGLVSAIDLPPPTDTELVELVAAGDLLALTALFERHWAVVRRAAVAFLADRADADDVVKSVFVGLWREPGRFDRGRGSLRSLLVHQARGRAIEMMRQRNLRASNAERVVRAAVRRPVRVEDVPRSHISENVSRALDVLSDDQRDALVVVHPGPPKDVVKLRIRAALDVLRTGVEAAAQPSRPNGRFASDNGRHQP